ncbi:flagellar basal-body rod protein FlgC [Thermaerobacter marianensis DSM 12885]|uniref:Flagellar basal-body rod protein FlgC n=1 Tax=Thermaerobacter marianensis (strain ATCC 700841 / DSM 12885 / JCM 10246 / 7p75a) TaxID=644966 RepID=E6SJM6_THEM7|nr:flagellar basal body rod protein FlgC [Thermaerobacter marianensis]ADU51089.1 flagellar basal-body rod protein FlgC [Thermaerobacter marianensis DSM 12885]
MLGGVFNTFDIAASGMTAQRLRLDLIASNLANVDTTRTAQGGPYRRLVPVFQERVRPFAEVLRERAAGFGGMSGSAGGVSGAAGWQTGGPAGGAGPALGGPALAGVQVAAVVADPSPPRLVYDPGHPDAGPDGYVAYPNVDPLMEMVNLLAATRAYEANVAVFSAARTLALRALEIGRG